jgi:hypothetical protein
MATGVEPVGQTASTVSALGAGEAEAVVEAGTAPASAQTSAASEKRTSCLPINFPPPLRVFH